MSRIRADKPFIDDFYKILHALTSVDRSAQHTPTCRNRGTGCTCFLLEVEHTLGVMNEKYMPRDKVFPGKGGVQGPRPNGHKVCPKLSKVSEASSYCKVCENRYNIVDHPPLTKCPWCKSQREKADA